MRESKWHKIFYFYLKEFPCREIPIVFLYDGQPGYVINQWIYYLLEEKITPAKLELYIRSLSQLYDLCMARRGQGQIREVNNKRLVADYIEARLLGTDEYCLNKTNPRYDYLSNLRLHWKPATEQNVKQNIKAINKFDKWQSTFHGAQRINPSESVFIDSYEIYREFKRSEAWNPFHRLFTAREHTKEVYRNDVGSMQHSRIARLKEENGTKKRFR